MHRAAADLQTDGRPAAINERHHAMVWRERDVTFVRLLGPNIRVWEVVGDGDVVELSGPDVSLATSITFGSA